MKDKDLSDITRQAWELVEFSKSSTLQNVTKAVASGDVSIDRSQLPKLLRLVQLSIEQGFLQGVKEFETQVDVIVSGITDTSKKN